MPVSKNLELAQLANGLDVNQTTGEVVTINLDTDVITEGTANLYFTNARADARIALATGANLDLTQVSIGTLSDVDITTSAPAPTIDEPREVPSGQGVIKLGDLVVDTNRRQVSRGGERIGLTYTEFSLLELLFRDPGRVVPRAEILEQLWGYPPRRAADLRVVDVYVARLRGKLEPDPRNPELILTVRGIGYASQRMGEFPTAIAS